MELKLSLLQEELTRVVRHNVWRGTLHLLVPRWPALELGPVTGIQAHEGRGLGFETGGQVEGRFRVGHGVWP